MFHRTLGHEDIMGTSGVGGYETSSSSKISSGTSGSILPLRLCLLICQIQVKVFTMSDKIWNFQKEQLLNSCESTAH